MLRIVTSLFIAVFIILGSSQASDLSARRAASPQGPITVTFNDELLTISLEKKTAFTFCEFSKNSCPKDGTRIRVRTTRANAKNDSVGYYYSVTAGQIEGTGPEVVWNLGNSAPGQYKISVGVGKDLIIDAGIASASIELNECPVCDPACECPDIAIIGPKALIRGGESFVLDAEIIGGKQQYVTYKWAVVRGVIIDGASSQRVFVKAAKTKINSSFEATVEIGGTDPTCNCPTEASKTIKIKSSKNE